MEEVVGSLEAMVEVEAMAEVEVVAVEVMAEGVEVVVVR